MARNNVLLEPTQAGRKDQCRRRERRRECPRGARYFCEMFFFTTLPDERLGAFTLAENSLEKAGRRREAQDCCGRTHVGIIAPAMKLVAAVFFRIEEFGEARIFLEEGKIFVVARVVAIGAAKFDGDFQIGERGVGFASETIERGECVNNVIGFGRELAGFVETFACVVPAAEIHHGHAALVMLVESAADSVPADGFMRCSAM